MNRHTEYSIIDGHPVPYSLTVQSAATGRPLAAIGTKARRYIDIWLAEHKPAMRVIRTDGAYVFYGGESETTRRAGRRIGGGMTTKRCARCGGLEKTHPQKADWESVSFPDRCTAFLPSPPVNDYTRAATIIKRHYQLNRRVTRAEVDEEVASLMRHGLQNCDDRQMMLAAALEPVVTYPIPL